MAHYLGYFILWLIDVPRSCLNLAFHSFLYHVLMELRFASHPGCRTCGRAPRNSLAIIPRCQSYYFARSSSIHNFNIILDNLVFVKVIVMANTYCYILTPFTAPVLALWRSRCLLISRNKNSLLLQHLSQRSIIVHTHQDITATDELFINIQLWYSRPIWVFLDPCGEWLVLHYTSHNHPSSNYGCAGAGLPDLNSSSSRTL